MEYTLNGNTPYAGIGITLAKEFPLLDLTGYSALRIKITTEKRTRFGVTIRTFEPGITEVKEDGFEPVRHKEIHSRLDQWSCEKYLFTIADGKKPHEML